jgi:cobalamin transport system substrate-binding protein
VGERWEGAGSRANQKPEDLPEPGACYGSDDLLSLVGWGKGEGEEVGAILRVVEALRIFCLISRRVRSPNWLMWSAACLGLTFAAMALALATDSDHTAMKRRQQGILTGMPFMANLAPRTFVDDLGRKIYLSKPPTRVVSLAPSITETLFAIGLGERVVGVTQFCDYPPEARAKPKVGYMHPNVESIVALQPDLVLAPREFIRADVLGKLEQLKIAAFILDAKTVEDIPAHIQTIGRMLDHSGPANQAAMALRQHLAELRTKIEALPRPRVLYVLNSQPLITVGPGSFLHHLIELAGGANVAARAKAPYPRLNMEEVIKEDPELIVFPGGGVEGIPEPERQLWQRWTTISAVRHRRFHEVPSDLLNRPGPRIVQGLERLARIIHLEAFTDSLTP